jgi:hypothetical protein
LCDTADMMGRPASLGAMGVHYIRPDLRHMADWHDEHMAPVAGLLTTARKHRGLAVAKRHNTRRQLSLQNTTEHARRCRFRRHLTNSASRYQRSVGKGISTGSTMDGKGIT